MGAQQNQQSLNPQQYEALTTEPPVDGEEGESYSAMLQRLTRKIYIENNRLV